MTITVINLEMRLMIKRGFVSVNSDDYVYKRWPEFVQNFISTVGSWTEHGSLSNHVLISFADGLKHQPDYKPHLQIYIALTEEVHHDGGQVCGTDPALGEGCLGDGKFIYDDKSMGVGWIIPADSWFVGAVGKCHVQRWPRFGWVWKLRAWPNMSTWTLHLCKIGWCVMSSTSWFKSWLTISFWPEDIVDSTFNMAFSCTLITTEGKSSSKESARGCSQSRRYVPLSAHHRVNRPHLYEGRGLFFRSEATDDMPRYLCAVASGVQDHHLLLVTLLLFNTVANEDQLMAWEMIGRANPWGYRYLQDISECLRLEHA